MRHEEISTKKILDPELISNLLAVNIEIYEGGKCSKYNSTNNLFVKPLSILKEEDSIAILYTRKLALELVEDDDMKNQLEQMNSKSLKKLIEESKMSFQILVAQSICLNSLAQSLKAIETSQSLSELNEALKKLSSFTVELIYYSDTKHETFWKNTKQSSQNLLETLKNLNTGKVIEALEQWKSKTDLPILEGIIEKEKYYNTCACCNKEMEKTKGLVLECNHFVDRQCLLK